MLGHQVTALLHIEFELAGHDFTALENTDPAAASARNDCAQIRWTFSKGARNRSKQITVFENSALGAESPATRLYMSSLHHVDWKTRRRTRIH